MDVLKVSAKSIPNSVAGAIAGVIREKGLVEIQAIGAGAANQAIKSVAIARTRPRTSRQVSLAARQAARAACRRPHVDAAVCLALGFGCRATGCAATDCE